MKRALLTLALGCFCAPALAQAPPDAYNAPPSSGGGVAGLTTANGGDAIADNEVIRGDGGTGIQGSPLICSDAGALSGLTTATASTGFTVATAGPTEKANLNATDFRLSSDQHIKFYSDPDIGSGTADVGFKRGAAGRLDVTNGGAGVGGLLVSGAAGGLLQLGGSTSSFPALKRSGTSVEVRLADDSSYGTLTVRTGPPAVYFGGTGATNAAVRTTAAATPLLEFVTATESAFANIAVNSVAYNGSDTRTSRVVAGVQSLDGSTVGNRAGWQQWAGECFVAADQTNATTTPQTSTCSISVTTGRKYAGKCSFYLTDSVAAEGAAIDFDGGTATATNFRSHCTGFDSALSISSQTTALATDVSASTFTGAGMFECHISFEPGSTGTFLPRFHQVTHATGTLTLARGSHCYLFDFP